MPGLAKRKLKQFGRVAAAPLAVGMLAGGYASAGDDERLQLGGFMIHADGPEGPVEQPVPDPKSLGWIEVGFQSSAAQTMPVVPVSAALPLGSGWINDFMLPEGTASASPALRAPRLTTEPTQGARNSVVSIFTPRFSGLQFGATYSPKLPGGTEGPSLPTRTGQSTGLLRDFAVGVNFLETFEGVDVALSSGYQSASVPSAAGLLGEALPGQDEALERYSVGTSIGFSGLKIGGLYVREVGDGPVSVQSWDAGVSYASGPWTVGVDYLRSASIDAERLDDEGDELHTVQAGLSYSVGPGIVASFNVLHSSLEDREGNATTGTLGILGFSYDF